MLVRAEAANESQSSASVPKSSNRVWLPRLKNQNSSSRSIAASCFSFGGCKLCKPLMATQSVQTGDTIQQALKGNRSNVLLAGEFRSSNPVATFSVLSLPQVLIGGIFRAAVRTQPLSTRRGRGFLVSGPQNRLLALEVLFPRILTAAGIHFLIA